MRLVRSLFAVVFLMCVACMAAAYYLQYHQGLMPCTLCIMQRLAYILVGLTALLGLICPYQRNGFRLWAFLSFLFAALGGVLAGRQVWLQHQPLDPNAPCVPGLNYLFRAFPFPKALNLALHGSTDCGQVNWTFLSLTMPEWSLFCFVIMAVLMVVVFFQRRKPF